MYINMCVLAQLGRHIKCMVGGSHDSTADPGSTHAGQQMAARAAVKRTVIGCLIILISLCVFHVSAVC